ncbi:MAG TPA: tryptophan--tRNA ligase [Planctomycetota bacterium]|nr:tryptophan--tRNA ligase [Planctomycetota bacterium]
MKKKRLLSGMRPTGPMHIGHYFGALQNWVALQEECEAFFMVADWHALTSEYQDSGRIPQYLRDNVADWLACGVDPEKATIFVQSAVPQHAELHLLLSCVTPLGWLERVPTYKDQMKELAAKGVDNYAFLGYPVLQAADIALYKGDCVPVGQDQIPHLELTREIVRRFNHIFKSPVFPEPQPKLTQVPLLLGLDGRKMSKSYGNAIGLQDTEAEIRKKVQSMFTDPARQRRTDPGHPEVCNVYSWHGLFSTPERRSQIYTECTTAAIGCIDCKKDVAGRVVEFLRPMRERRKELDARPGRVDEILQAGNAKARSIAEKTMAEVREAVFHVKPRA